MTYTRVALTTAVAGSVGALSAFVVIYAYPRIKERILPPAIYTMPEWSFDQRCTSPVVFRMDATPATIIKTAKTPHIVPQGFAPIDEFSTVVSVEHPGTIDLTFKLEMVHRGDRYSEVIGAGAFITYQHAQTLAGLDEAPVNHPDGWTGGTNIRDLRDHYGQINIIGALAVTPGFYRFCVSVSAHSALFPENTLAALLVETKSGPLNTLRLKYSPNERLLH